MKKFIMSVLVMGMAFAGGSQLRAAAAAPGYDSKELSNHWYSLSRAIEDANLEGVQVIVPALIERGQRRNQFIKPGGKPIASQGKTAYEIAKFHFDLSRKKDGVGPASKRTFDLQAIVEYLMPAALAQEELKVAGGAAPGGAPFALPDEVAVRRRIEALAGNIRSLLGGGDLYLAIPLMDSIQRLVKKYDYPLIPKQYSNERTLGMSTLQIIKEAILETEASVVEAAMNGGYVSNEKLPRLQQLFNENYRFIPGPVHNPVEEGRYVDRDGNVVGSPLQKGHAIDELGYKRLEIDRIKAALRIP